MYRGVHFLILGEKRKKETQQKERESVRCKKKTVTSSKQDDLIMT